MFAQLIIHFLILGFQLIQCQSPSANQNSQDYLNCNAINCQLNLEEHTLESMNSDGKSLLVVGLSLLLQGNVVLSGFSEVTFSNLMIDTHCFQIESDSKLVFINTIINKNLKINVPSVMFQDSKLVSIKYENEGIFPNSKMVRTSLKNMVLINTLIFSDLLFDVILDSSIIINSTFIGKVDGLTITNSSIFDSQMLVNSDLNNINVKYTRFSQSIFISNNLLIINNLHITNSILDQSKLIQANTESELNMIVLQNITTNANIINLFGLSTIIMNLTLISIQTTSTIFTINTNTANISNVIISDNQFYQYRVFLIDQVDIIQFNNIQMVNSNLVQLIYSNNSNAINLDSIDINNIFNQQIEILNFNQPEMLNITNIQIKNVFSNTVLFTINNSNVVNIQNGLFQNIQTLEVISIINGIYSEIQYINFKDILIQNGTINIINSGKSKLFDLSFVNINGNYGGGINNKNSPLILSNITFDNMTAYEGGAIYLEQVRLDEISMNEIYYINSKAQKGDKILLKTNYLDNQLQNTFVDGPVYIYINNQTYSINELLLNKSKITFPKIKSSQNNDYSLYLQDTSKQNICHSIDTLIFENQTINASSSCSFTIKFHHLQIYPINETIGIPIVFQDGKQIILYFEMQECELGEIWLEQSCIQCQAGTYSLNYTQNCQNCPSSVQACPGGALLVLREGYWRPHNLTDQIELCTISSSQCQGGSDNFTCQEGYVGALCNDCDYYQTYWPQSYSQSILEGCEQCNSNIYVTLQATFSLLWILIALIMSVRGALKMVRAQLQGYYLKVLGFLFATRSMMVIDQTEILIKIFTGYFQLVSIVMVLEVNLPFPFDYVVSAIGSPLKTLAYSTECLLLYMNLTEEIIYVKQMWSLFLSLILIIILVAVFAIFKLCNKQENSLKIIFSTSMIQVFYYFQGDIIQGMLSLVFCIKASGQYYIQAATQYLCYTDNYYFHMNILIIPTLSVVAIILPLFYLLKLILNRNKLWTCRFRSQYGYLFTEYKDNLFYWEFIKMFLKFLFYILQTVLLQEIKLMFLLAILCLVIYQELLSVYMPYIDKRYNHLEKLSIQFAIVTLVLAYFQDSNPYIVLVYISQSFCAALNLLYILYFFLRLLLELCIELKHVLNSYIIYLLKRYIWLNKYIKKPREFKLKKRVQFLWKKARFEVKSFIQGLKPQENSEQQSSLDKKPNFSIDLSNEPNLLNSLKPSYLKLIQRQTTMRESQSPQTRDQSPETRAFSPQESPGQFDNFSMAISTYFQTKTQSEHMPSQTTVAQLYQKKHSKEIAKVYPEPGQETNFKKLIKKAF